MPNFAVLSAAVFPFSTKPLREGTDIGPPSVRALMKFYVFIFADTNYIVGKKIA